MNSIWQRVKAAITRATPVPADPRGDREMVAWLARSARENDRAMPPQPAGMRISQAAISAASSLSPAQQDAVARQLEGISPRTPAATPDSWS